MTLLGQIVLANLIISLCSLIGVVTLGMSTKSLSKILMYLVAFSAGTLMGNAFLDLIPEAANNLPISTVMGLTLVSFIGFFFIEKVLHWRHCHNGQCDTHSFGTLNLLGDAIHNCIDGLVIAGTFLLSPALGLSTTFAMAAHEIPQEIGDFGVLLHAGFTKRKAIMANLAVALTSVLGGILGFSYISQNPMFSYYLLPIAAGGFIYIAGSDLLPEIRKETHLAKSIASFGLFLLGIVVMMIAGE
jgi:zinc and cadmium transporter